MRLGAHVSSAGGLDKAVVRAQKIGAEAMQIFCSSPRSWVFKPVPVQVGRAFREKTRIAGIAPIFLHGIYLINLGSQNKENLHRGIESLINYMHVAKDIGAAGVVFHLGSHRGAGFHGILRQAIEALRRVLDNSPSEPFLLIENSAGMGEHIGSRFSEIAAIMDELDSNRVRICLDTQHAFAAGYNVADPEGMKATLEEFDREIGLSFLALVHANDSKLPLGSGVDRHENLGIGHIGLDGFQTLMSTPVFKDVPFILEVPGTDGNGPDKVNLDILKAIREKL